MGGVWAPPLKLADGVWFGVGDQWVGPATTFHSGQGYTRYDLPDAGGLGLSRTDFTPDGSRAALFGLTLTNPGSSDVTVPVKVDAHSELMTAYPWGFDGVKPNASDNIADHGSYADGTLQFTDDGALPDGAPEHHYAALVAADQPADSGEAADTGGAFRGPQGGHVCQNGDQSLPKECDDGPFGKGTGGELRYTVTVPAGGSKTLWVAVAGSDKGLTDARVAAVLGARRPGGQLAAKQAARQKLAANTQVTLPGDTQLQNAIDWGKQNLADLTQTASDLKIRWTNQGKQFPAPLGTIPSATWFGAGFPDYPWIFATDGEYTDFAAVALGQFDTAKAHLRTLRDISDVLNNRSGIVVHETVSDGSVWFGHDSQTTERPTAPRPTTSTLTRRSSSRAPWRSCGAGRATTPSATRCTTSPSATSRPSTASSTSTATAGRRARATSSARAWARRSSTTASTTSARSTTWPTWRSPRATRPPRSGRRSSPRRSRSSSRARGGTPRCSSTPTRSTTPATGRTSRSTGSARCPMEAELTSGTDTQPGVASYDARHDRARRTRELVLQRRAAGQPRALPHRLRRRRGPHGRRGDLLADDLDPGRRRGQLRPPGRDPAAAVHVDALAEPMFSEPATQNTPDEQPGAMPEIFPSNPQPGNTGVPPNIDRCWTCRSMFMQAWGNYGTAWSVVHQQLGVRPFVNRGVVEVVPQVPPGAPSVSGSNIRLGTGALAVFASHSGSTYTTKAQLTGSSVRSLVIGHTLPRGSKVRTVTLDGQVVHGYGKTTTNRGVEITVPTTASGQHTLTVTTA